ncbi:hypothetical protein UFOVP272_30 [uncultured Caudovirales phage]|uniref:Uncharacterized protein n=1 Tax=uncultured Caudovirales phage TaxID=2100421 RepID=A0A6J5LHU9_9CAUD|nr:hypothetical protein UFOVP272_30 [uncultured Caudovirales phage]
MNPIKFRASSLSEIMTDPKGKDEILSVGAKTAIAKIAKEIIYGYDEQFSSKYTEKGLRVEDESIDLLGSVLLKSFVKNKERKTNDWITGEPDIVTEDSIIDIKSSWSLATFPVIADQGKDKGYEMQLRAYMWLWDKPKATIAYCLVNTPEDLMKWEAQSLHSVDHIIPELRVTLVHYERDRAIEEKIKFKVEAARQYFEEICREIGKQHEFI